MATEFKLSYTGDEVNSRLGQVDTNTTKLNELENDISSLETELNQKADKSEIPEVSNFITIDDAHSYADTAASSAATTLKNDLLNGAGAAYDTLKELGDLISENTTAIDALETVATGKADASHTHAVGEVTGLGSLATKNTVAKSDLDTSVQASLSKADSALQSYTETDPTVPAWAKAANKPSYTASEVGALPDTTVIPTVPTNVSAFTNDAGYLTKHQDLSAYAKTADLGDLATKDSLTASEVGADASGTASSLVANHNTATDAHADIRASIAEVDAKIVNEIAIMTQSEYDSMTQSDLAALYANGVRMIAITENSYTNLVSLAIDANGNIYNGTGYMDDYRLNSSGEVVEAAGCTHTGFIPYVANSVMRSKGSTAGTPSATGHYIALYDSDFNLVALEDMASAISETDNGTYVTGDDGYDIFTFDFSTVSDAQQATFAYFRISHASCNGANLIITIEEPSGDSGTTVTYVNLVPLSTDTDGSIFNDTGYKDNARLSSSGGVSGTAQNGSVVTGFIPCKVDDIIRIKGATWVQHSDSDAGHYYINFYKADKTFIEGISASSYSSNSTPMSVVYDDETGITTFDITDGGAFASSVADAAYFRINAYGCGADLIVTVNEEI